MSPMTADRLAGRSNGRTKRASELIADPILGRPSTELCDGALRRKKTTSLDEMDMDGGR